MTEKEIIAKAESIFQEKYRFSSERIFSDTLHHHDILNETMVELVDVIAIEGDGIFTILQGKKYRIPVIITEVFDFESVESLREWAQELRLFESFKEDMESTLKLVEELLDVSQMKEARSYLQDITETLNAVNKDVSSFTRNDIDQKLAKIMVEFPEKLAAMELQIKRKIKLAMNRENDTEMER